MMKTCTHFKRIYCFIIFVLTFLMVSCADGATDNETAILANQTLWQITDRAGNIETYLPENDSDIVAIIDLIEMHIACVDNRSANDVHFSEEARTYSPDFLESLILSGYDQKLEKMYGENKLEISAVSVIWNPSIVNAEKTSCKVDIDSVFQFTSASDEYLDKLQVELNTNYSEHRIYYCEKIDGTWKITNIVKSALYQ